MMISFLSSAGTNSFLKIPKHLKRCSISLSGILLVTSMGAAYAAPFAYLGDSQLNSVAIVDLANYTTIGTLPLDAMSYGIPEIVANDATGKVYVATQSGVKIIDSTTNTITGQIPLSFASTDVVKAMVVSPDGGKVYVLTRTGKLAAINATTKSVVATVNVGSFGLALAIDTTGKKVYVSNRDAASAPALTIINGDLNTIEKVVPTGTFAASALLVNPADDRVFMTSEYSTVTEDLLSYHVFDPSSSALTRVMVTPINPQFQILNFTSLAFNKDGSRLYMGGHTGPLFAKIPVLEVDSTNGNVTKALLVPNGYADEHTAIKLATSFAGGKFVLAVFLNEHLHHYPVEPARRAVFVDVASNTVLKDLSYTQYGDGDMLIGDILDPKPVTGIVSTTTTLVANSNSPLRRNIPVNFTATVKGNNPTGKVIFKFMADKKNKDGFETVSIALQKNVATVTIPACNGNWEQQVRKIVCSNAFTVSAYYEGDANNKKSASAILAETR